jgi:hypothetical protein
LRFALVIRVAASLITNNRALAVGADCFRYHYTWTSIVAQPTGAPRKITRTGGDCGYKVGIALLEAWTRI